MPNVVTNVQTGCAHFSAFSRAIIFLPTSDQERTIQALMLVTRKKCFCTERNTLRYWLDTRSPRWQSIDCRVSANGCDRIPGLHGPPRGWGSPSFRVSNCEQRPTGSSVILQSDSVGREAGIVTLWFLVLAMLQTLDPRSEATLLDQEFNQVSPRCLCDPAKEQR